MAVHNSSTPEAREVMGWETVLYDSTMRWEIELARPVLCQGAAAICSPCKTLPGFRGPKAPSEEPPQRPHSREGRWVSEPEHLPTLSLSLSLSLDTARLWAVPGTGKDIELPRKGHAGLLLRPFKIPTGLEKKCWRPQSSLSPRKAPIASRFQRITFSFQATALWIKTSCEIQCLLGLS